MWPRWVFAPSGSRPAGRQAGGVCGGAAADPLLACVLVGLGVTSLSCAASAVPRVGCEQAARAALAAAREVLGPA